MHLQEVRTTTIALCISEKKNLISMAKSYNLPKTVPVIGHASLDEYLFDECLLSNFHSSALITLYTQPQLCKKHVNIPSTLPDVPPDSLTLTSRIKHLLSDTSALVFTHLSGPGQPVPDQ